MTDQDINTPVPVKFISSKEASERFGYTPDYVSKLAREGKVRGHKSGRAWFVEPESLHAFIQEAEVLEQQRLEELHRIRIAEYRNGQAPVVKGVHPSRIHPLAHLMAPVLGAAVFSVAVGMGYAFVEVRPLARVASLIESSSTTTVDEAKEGVDEVLESTPTVTVPSLEVVEERVRENFSLAFPTVPTPNVLPDARDASSEISGESLHTLFLDAPVVIVYASRLVVDAYVDFLLDVPRIAASLHRSAGHALRNPHEFGTRLSRHLVSLWHDRDLIAHEIVSDLLEAGEGGQRAYTDGVKRFVYGVHSAVDVYVNGVFSAGRVVTSARSAFPSVAALSSMPSAARSVLSLWLNDVYAHATATREYVASTMVTGARSPQLALSWSPQTWISDVGTLLWGVPEVYIPPPLIIPRGTVTTVSTSPTLIQNITQPLTISGVSTDLLTTRLQELENELRNEIYLYSARAERGISGNYRAIGLTNVINNLDGVTIRNATIIGGSISGTSGIGSAGASDLDDLSDVTIASPALGQVLLYDGSTWNNVATSSLGITGGGGSSFGQTFELTNGALAPTTTVGILVSASSTIQSLSATNSTSTNATSTNLFTSNLTVGSLSGILKATSGVVSAATAGVDYLTDAFRSWTLSTNTFSQSALAPTTTQNLLINGVGTSTFAGGLEAWRQIAAPYFQATSTTATSTFSGGVAISGGLNLFGVYGNSWDDFCTSITGGSGLCDGADNTGGGAGLATSTDIVDTYIIYGTSASDVGAEAAFTYDDATNRLTVENASTTRLSATYASSTQAFFGSLSVGNLTGLLRATAGVVATATIDLVNDVGSSILAVVNGGTGWGNIQANSILLGNGTSRLATTSAGTNGQILSLVAGVPSWVATTTFSGGLTYSAGNVTADLGTSIDISSETNLAVSATGLELSGDTIALSTGYNIPLNASTTNWNSFYDTPSTRITAGTGLSWAGNTLNATGGSSFGQAFELTTNTFSQSALAPTTTRNLLINGVGTSTFAGGLEAWRQIAAPYFHATSTTATSTIAGGLVLRDGTEGSPSLSFASDLTSGIYRSASQRVGVTVNGAKSFEFLGSSNAYISSGLFRIANGTVGGPAYSFSNDTNTGIFTTGGDTLNFSTGGVEQARFTSTGRFGVGTSTPLAQLSASSTSAIGLIVDQRGTSDIAQFQIAGANALAISGIGFGTTTLAGLNIAGSATSTSNVGFNITSGCFAINGICVSGSSGITAIGPTGQTQTGSTITIASSTSSFNGLTVSNTIVGSGNTLTWTPALSGTLDNTGLTNSTVSFGGVSLALGGSDATPAFNLADATGLPIVAGTTGTLTATRGGTGLSTIASSSLLIGGAGNTWLQFATSSLGIAISDTTGTLAETRGGTNQTSYATGDILYASGANTLSRLAAGTGGFVLSMASGVPAWVASTTLATISGTLNLVTQVSGILGATNGGTGWANIQANSILLGNGTSRLATTSAGTNGQVLSLVSGVPSWVATTTYGTGLTYSGGNVTVNTSQNIATLSNLTSNGFVTTSGGNGTLAVDTTSYTPTTRALTIAGTANQITSSAGAQDLSGDRTWTLSIPSLFSIQLASTTGLSALGNLYAGNGTATTTIVGNATSTFGAGIEATYLNITGTAATSTFARGIDLAGGCFAINGTCVGGGSGSPGGSDGQLQYNNGGSFGGASSVYYDDVNNLLGIGSTSPWAKLAVNPVAGDTNQFVVGSSTATSFIINSAGNVGIGTTSPMNKFTVVGTAVNDTLWLDSATNNTALNINNSGSGGRRFGLLSSSDAATVPSSFRLYDFTAAVDRLVVNSTGKVGIGTTTPLHELDVYESANPRISINADGANSNPGIELVNDARSWLIQNQGVDSDKLYFHDQTALATRMVIDSAGNVGIGTTSPDKLLHVSGSSPTVRVRDTGANGTVLDFGVTNTLGTIDLTAYNTIAADLAIRTGNSERVRITQNGNVGIGTTTPQSKLSVVSGTNGTLFFPTGNWAAQIYNQDDNSTSGGLVVGNRWANNSSIVLDVGSLYGTGSAWTSFFTVKGGGNVGVGVTDPDTRLEVFETVAGNQLKLSYDATRYTALQVTSVGDLVIDAEGGDVSLLDENLFVCAGGSCPAGTPTGTGNLVVERGIGVNTATPIAGISVGADSAIVTTEKNISDASPITVDWNQGNQQLIRLAASRTVNFSNASAGQTLRLIVCTTVSSRTVTWGSTIRWAGGTAPTQTATANKCDVFSFIGTIGHTGSSVVIFGAGTLNF